MINEQWHERLNTNIDVGPDIGVTGQQQVLLTHVTEESNKFFEDVNSEEKKETQEYAEECYLSYIFLRQSGNHHKNITTNLQNDFTTGDYQYSKIFQATLHLLEKYI